MTNNIQLQHGNHSTQNQITNSGNSNHQASTCNKSTFGATITTNNVRSDLGKLQCSIHNELNCNNSQFGRELNIIRDLLNGIMEKMTVQAGGQKTCSSAGQMTDLIKDYSDASNQFKTKPAENITRVRDVLLQIQQLLGKLNNTMHTDIKSQMKFQNRY